MNVGDLVKYNYGPAKGSGPDYWGAAKGELGVIVDSCWCGDPEVAEILWFNKHGLQRSYKKYLIIVSNGKRKDEG